MGRSCGVQYAFSTLLGSTIDALDQVLNNFIKTSGSSEGGSYFLGSRYSYAETVTTPFLRRALVTLPHFKRVDPLEIAKSKGLNRLVDWIQVSYACLRGFISNCPHIIDVHLVTRSFRKVATPSCSTQEEH